MYHHHTTPFRLVHTIAITLPHTHTHHHHYPSSGKFLVSLTVSFWQTNQALDLIRTFSSVCLLFINNCVKLDGLELELLELQYYITLIWSLGGCYDADRKEREKERMWLRCSCFSEWGTQYTFPTNAQNLRTCSHSHIVQGWVFCIAQNNLSIGSTMLTYHKSKEKCLSTLSNIVQHNYTCIIIFYPQLVEPSLEKGLMMYIAYMALYGVV